MSYFYFRRIAGFVGMAIIAGGSVFLSQHIYSDRSPEPSVSVLAACILNTAVFCAVAWKVLQNYKKRRDGQLQVHKPFYITTCAKYSEL